MRWMRRHGRMWRCIVGDRQSRAPRRGQEISKLSGRVGRFASFMETVHAASTACRAAIGRAVGWRAAGGWERRAGCQAAQRRAKPPGWLSLIF